MNLRYRFKQQRKQLSSPGLVRVNRLPNKCSIRRARRPSASGSSNGESSPIKQGKQSRSKLNRLIPALLEERKGFGVLLTVTLTTVSRVAQQYISSLLKQEEENSKEQSCTAQDETSQTSDPQIQARETAKKITDEKTDKGVGSGSVSIEQKRSSSGESPEGNRDSSQAGNFSLTDHDRRDATGNEKDGVGNLQMDQNVQKAMLHGRHISLLTSPLSAEEVQRMGSGFTSKKQGTGIPKQIVQSNSEKGKQTKSVSTYEVTGGGNIGDGGHYDGGGGGNGNSNGGEGDDDDGRLFFTLIVISGALIALFGFAAMNLDFNTFYQSTEQIQEST